ncbi:hypothetical protein COZ35_01840 [Candidatus Peregrinibacteria bacterium CG_4_10_14_3_um_filter_44_21]|nr:MAG: hypothetical protein COZ35_01840 [Candidatus Peregrinibacteria bacterium CG_4_10_14_3_um_filter_44_21]
MFFSRLTGKANLYRIKLSELPTTNIELTMLQKILENIGLTEKEAKIYLAMIELGETVVSAIANKAGVNRVTTYDSVDKLTQKGFATKRKTGKKLLFTAVDPQIISLDFRARARDLRKSIPDFKRLKGEMPRPEVRYFEGLSGIKQMYLDTLSSKTEILNYSDSEGIRHHWPDHDEEYVKARVKKKIYLRGICPNDEHGMKVRSQDWDCHREIRLIPKDQYDFSNEINIYDNKVAIISYDKTLVGILIENASIANTQRAIFKMAWQFAR